MILFEDTPTDIVGPLAERDERMAAYLLRERDASMPTLVVAGGFHTLIAEQSEGVPLGVHAVDAAGRVPTGRLDYDSGPMRFYRGGDGVYVFELPDDRLGFVPRLP